MLREIRILINEYVWHWQFRRMHPVLALGTRAPQKLRIVLGVARSGTSWLSEVLASTPTPIRFFKEPLHHIIPRLAFSEGYEHTAIQYRQSLPSRHRLIKAYQLLTVPFDDWASVGLDRFLLRNDLNWEFCLVKEVHSLLASEGLVRSIKCPTVVISRNPLYIVDSTFTAHTLRTEYLCHEFTYVITKEFLNRFVPEQASAISQVAHWTNTIAEERLRMITQKTLTVALIQVMFHTLAQEYKNVYLVQYEELCEKPHLLFSSAAAFLSLDWDSASAGFLEATTQSGSDPNPHGDGRYSIFQRTSKQIERPFRFLTREEVELARRLLSDAGLDVVM